MCQLFNEFSHLIFCIIHYRLYFAKYFKFMAQNINSKEQGHSQIICNYIQEHNFKVLQSNF